MRIVLIPIALAAVLEPFSVSGAQHAETLQKIGRHPGPAAYVEVITALELEQVGASRTALAIVTDGKNRAIVDVGADDFVILEAGQEREILSVRPADYPVVVLLDTGADARTDFGLMRKAVTRFIDRIGQRPVAIGTLGDPPRMLTTFEDDRQKVMDTLEALEFSPTARSMLLQGTAVAADAIHATGTLFSALVVLSATPGDSSRPNPDGMIASIVDSGAMLHVIANRATQIVGQMGQIRSGTAMRSIAEQTRGQYTVVYSPASYQPALDRLAERLTSEMMVEYLVPPGSKPADVRVGVHLAGARVRGLGVAPK